MAGMPHLPRGYDMYSNDVIPAHMAAWANQNPELKPLLITLFDTWIFKGEPWNLLLIRSRPGCQLTIPRFPGCCRMEPARKRNPDCYVTVRSGRPSERRH